MTSDLDPERESALRRRLASFADVIVLPPATDGEVPPEASVLGSVHDRPHRPRRPVALAAAAATVAVAGAAAVLALTDGDRDDDTEAGTTTSAAAATTGTVPSGDCEPRVAEDGVIASGPTEDGGGWEVRVSGAPPRVATEVIVDGASTGGTMSDELSRAPVVNSGYFPISAGIGEHGAIVYGEVPRETAVVEVVTTGDGVSTACPVTVPNDELIAWFGLSLPPGIHPAGARALDAGGRVLASGDFPTDGPFSVELGGSFLTDMIADPALVDLPLGGTEVVPPPEVPRTEIASSTAGGSPWTLRAALDGESLDIELGFEGGASAMQQGPTPLSEQATWSLEEVGDQTVVWGAVPAEVTTVTVTFDDATTVDIGTVCALADGSARAFAGTLAGGATPIAIDARRADGSIVLQATEVAENVAVLADAEIGGTQLVAVPPS